MDYEIGKKNVIKIEPSNQGSKKNTMYLIHFSDREYLFVGMLEHHVEYFERIEEQTTIFDYL